MLVEEKIYYDKDETIGYYEAVFTSSNVLATTYFPKNELLYISFKRGGVYSYSNIDLELYNEFKNAESQGEFFQKEINKYPKKFLYRKEYTLYPNEIKNLNEMVEKKKEKNNDNPNIENLVKRIKENNYIENSNAINKLFEYNKNGDDEILVSLDFLREEVEKIKQQEKKEGKLTDFQKGELNMIEKLIKKWI